MRSVNALPYYQKWLVMGILIGIAAGIGAIIFYFALQYTSNLFLTDFVGTTVPNPVGEGGVAGYTYYTAYYYLIPVAAVIGGLIAGIIIYTFAPESEGHGTDTAISAFHNNDGKILRRTPIVKTIASAITIGSGGSGGREGPTALIAAGIGSWISDVFKLSDRDRRIAVLVGIGAGIGTIFKAPMGGAILAIEVPYLADFETGAIFPAVIASAVGYTIFGSMVGFQPLFGYYIGTFDPSRLPLYALLGLITGLAAIAYVKTFYKLTDRFKSMKIPNHFKPAIGGLTTGLIGLLFPEVLATGYGWVQILINGSFNLLPTFGLPLLAILILLPIAKMVATSFSIGSGGSGGVFGPGMVIGASIGAAAGFVFHALVPSLAPNVAPFVIVGMLAFFGAAGKVPISVLIMITEMTGSLQLLPAAMTAVVFSYVVSGQKSIYRSQRPHRIPNTMKLAKVKLSRIKSDSISVSVDSRPRAVLAKMKKLNMYALPVVRGRKFVGIVYRSALTGYRGYIIEPLVVEDITPLGPYSDAEEALELMMTKNATWVPVSSGDKYIGLITLSSIMKEYEHTIRRNASSNFLKTLIKRGKTGREL